MRAAVWILAIARDRESWWYHNKPSLGSAILLGLLMAPRSCSDVFGSGEHFNPRCTAGIILPYYRYLRPGQLLLRHWSTPTDSPVFGESIVPRWPASSSSLPLQLRFYGQVQFDNRAKCMTATADGVPLPDSQKRPARHRVAARTDVPRLPVVRINFTEPTSYLWVHGGIRLFMGAKVPCTSPCPIGYRNHWHGSRSGGPMVVRAMRFDSMNKSPGHQLWEENTNTSSRISAIRLQKSRLCPAMHGLYRA